jgi:uncharacterized protein
LHRGGIHHGLETRVSEPGKKGSNVQLILGQTHFIKSVEDIHEALVAAVSGIKVGLAFCEGPASAWRWSGTDPP